MKAAGILLMAALSAPSPAGHASGARGPAPELELISQARFAERAGDAKRAAALAETALGMVQGEPGETVEIHREAQDILLAAGRRGWLVRFYDGLLDASGPVRQYLRARVEPDAARRRSDLEAALADDPDLFWVAYDLAELHALDGDWERAASYAERATVIRPGEAAAWNVLGHLRLEACRLLADPDARRSLAEEARDALSAAVQLDPKLAEAHYNLGLVRYVLGEPRAASRSWLRAVALKGDFAEALNSLGHLSAREGKLDEAISFYEKAIAARPGYGPAHNNLAVAYYRDGRHAQAYEHMAKAEAAGHAVAPSFRRAVVREDEKRAFLHFQRQLAEARSRSASVLLPADEERAVLSAVQAREVVAAMLKARFRDSGGGVSLGEKRLHGKRVACYREAARVRIRLDPGGMREFLVIAREGASGGRGELVTWVAEAGYRFSADAPELVRLLSDALDLGVEGDRVVRSTP
jgi:tetratricopeptide (TPR) repeat protein